MDINDFSNNLRIYSELGALQIDSFSRKLENDYFISPKEKLELIEELTRQIYAINIKK